MLSAMLVGITPFNVGQNFTKLRVSHLQESSMTPQRIAIETGTLLGLRGRAIYSVLRSGCQLHDQ